jgi:hypothetical protein
MIPRRLALCAPAACLLALAPVAARSDAATGYAGRGAIVIQTQLGETKLTVGGTMAFEESDPFVRIDLLTLGIPGADPTLSAVMGTQLFPPGGFTVVYDRSASTYTVWSNAKHTFYAPPVKPAATAPASTPVPVASATPAPANGLFAVFGFLRSLRDDRAFNVSLALTGHGRTNGHPTTGLHFEYLKTTTGGETSNIHGELQVADDLNEIPVEIAVSVQTKGIPASAVRLDATSIAQANPPSADFTVPQGYARAASLGDVIGKVLPQ